MRRILWVLGLVVGLQDEQRVTARAWRSMQYELATSTAARSYSIQLEDFDVEYMDSCRFQCGTAQNASGCFHKPRLIRLGRGPCLAWAARHEAGHAILFALEDPRWYDYGH